MSELIRKQDAVDAAIKADMENHNGILSKKRARVLEEHIAILPSAQPERIEGHWIEIASSNHTYKCSACGRLLVNITDGKNNVAKNYPYCHCGADMRGEAE